MKSGPEAGTGTGQGPDKPSDPPSGTGRALAAFENLIRATPGNQQDIRVATIKLRQDRYAQVKNKYRLAQDPETDADLPRTKPREGVQANKGRPVWRRSKDHELL